MTKKCYLAQRLMGDAWSDYHPIMGTSIINVLDHIQKYPEAFGDSRDWRVLPEPLPYDEGYNLISEKLGAYLAEAIRRALLSTLGGPDRSE